MSTYAVFGMTRPAAIELAKKLADKEAGNVAETKWHKIVTEEADRIMKSNRCVMLSNKFDAPQFARTFKELAAHIESRDLHIKAHRNTGQFTKTGRTRFEWVPVS